MERYDAQDTFHAWYEHWHRYHWIAPLVVGKNVVDLACGEGYGSALLAQHAHHVSGIDIDQQSIKAASKKYPSPNLSYLHANALSTPLEDSSMDVVISFETLEHLAEQQQLLAEFKRVLKPGGLMVLSTPDKAVYSGEHHHNEYHVKELYADEFETLVATKFKHVIYFGQEIQTNSLLAPIQLDKKKSGMESLYVAQQKEFEVTAKRTSPTYLIAVASDSVRTLQPFQSLGASYFNDVNNSLLMHYEKQITNFIKTDQQLIAVNKKLAVMEQQVHQQRLVISQLQARLGL